MRGKKRIERLVSNRVFGRLGELPKSIQMVSERTRYVTTSYGNRIMVLPGVKSQEIRALYPSNWKNKKYYQSSGRMRKGGLVFSAQTADSKGKIFEIQCRTIREHYTTTHEARMLSYLKTAGFNIEQPLGIVITPEGERFIVTRRLERTTGGMFDAVKDAEKKLLEMGVVPEDLHRHGIPNYVFAKGPKGEPVLYLIDVEHYYSKDRNSRLYGSRMARR